MKERYKPTLRKYKFKKKQRELKIPKEMEKDRTDLNKILKGRIISQTYKHFNYLTENFEYKDVTVSERIKFLEKRLIKTNEILSNYKTEKQRRNYYIFAKNNIIKELAILKEEKDE